jgi:hypothetical protein
MPRSPTDENGTGAVSPDEAFALLGHDTRVGILQALWDAFESGKGDNALPYSELFEQVDIRDSGNFSYHLEKLTGPFVRQTDEGYELKQTGINVVRAVIAGTVTTDSAFGPTVVDVNCPLCTSPVEIVYADEFMNISCTTCAGRSRWNDESGHLFGALVPPTGISQHSIEEAFHAAVTYSLSEIAIFHQGVCPHCLGPVEPTVDTCTVHDPPESGRCPNCDRVNMANVWMVCSTCKRSIPPPVTLIVLNHPNVTAFYHEHGIEHQFATWETVARSYRVEEELLSEDPLRIHLTIPAEDDRLRLTIDDEVDVVDVSR